MINRIAELNALIATKNKQLHTWWLRGEPKRFRERQEKLTTERDYALAQYNECCVELQVLETNREQSAAQVATLRIELNALKGELFALERPNLIERLKELHAEQVRLENTLGVSTSELLAKTIPPDTDTAQAFGEIP